MYHQQGKFDLAAWFVNHGEAQTRPTLNRAIAGLIEQGVTEFAATGYCFGGAWVTWFIWDQVDIYIGRYVFDLAFENDIKVSVVSHPSLLKVPEDLEVSSNVCSLELWLTTNNPNRHTSKNPKYLSLSTVALPMFSSLTKVKPKLTRFSVKENFPMDTRWITMKDVPMGLLFVATWVTPRRKLQRRDRSRKPFNGSLSISD